MSKITPEAAVRCAASPLADQLAKWKASLSAQELRQLNQVQQSQKDDQADTVLALRGEHKRGFE